MLSGRMRHLIRRADVLLTRAESKVKLCPQCKTRYLVYIDSVPITTTTWCGLCKPPFIVHYEIVVDAENQATLEATLQ